MKRDELRMSIGEAERVKIVGQVLAKRLSQKAASEELGLSYRQMKRVVQRVRGKGDAGVIHQGRGRPSNRQIGGVVKNEILGLYQAKYGDFGPTFFGEKLAENHGITISKESLRQLLISEGIHRSKTRRDAQIHVWRERRHHEGELIQIDGSHHRWLEDRLDQEFCLIAYIDDATNRVFARFYEYEGTFPILDSFQRYIQQNGIPISVYLDRHSTYKVNRKTTIDEDLEGDGPNTQFEQIMATMGVQVIHAKSPQAKGRVERLFETLQDRLVKELRLNDIKTIPEANVFLETYLDKHNERFCVIPHSMISRFKPVPADFDYHWTFAVRITRSISKDFTIRFCNRVFLIKNPQRTLQGQKVLVKQALDGQLRFETTHRILSVKEVTDHAIDRVKCAQKELKVQLKRSRADSKKSKKSWMDQNYLGKQAFADTSQATAPIAA
jgi:transposase